MRNFLSILRSKIQVVEIHCREPLTLSFYSQVIFEISRDADSVIANVYLLIGKDLLDEKKFYVNNVLQQLFDNGFEGTVTFTQILGQIYFKWSNNKICTFQKFVKPSCGLLHSTFDKLFGLLLLACFLKKNQ